MGKHVFAGVHLCNGILAVDINLYLCQLVQIIDLSSFLVFSLINYSFWLFIETKLNAHFLIVSFWFLETEKIYLFLCIEKNPTLCHPSLFESLEYWGALNTSHSIPRSRGLKLRKLVGTSFKSLFIPNLCSSHLTWQGPTANGAMLFTPNLAGPTANGDKKIISPDRLCV